MPASSERLRGIPSIDRVVQNAGAVAPEVPAPMLVRAARAEVADLRLAVQAGATAPSVDQVAQAAALRAQLLLQDAPRPVVNATGVIIHTNLGRAPLSDASLEAVRAVASGYSNLEFDLAAGGRGARSAHIGDIVRELTGAEAALVLNNNAGALFLTLEALCAGREVLVSRGEAVEIGGGFRIPEILSMSGAVLRDVGTTNRTRLDDYAKAITDQTAAILRVHRSNFAQVGFTASPQLAELGELARKHNLLLIDDLGSGSLLDTSRFGLAREPLVQESLAAGAQIVTFSGDKLLGGPQAGVVVGEAAVVDTVARRPLARALRPGKMTIAALRATLAHYLREEAEQHVPVWQMIAAAPESLGQRAAALSADLPGWRVVESSSAVGGGSLPGQTLPSFGLQMDSALGSAEDVASRLRRAERPVIGRIAEDRVLLDLRTVLPRDEEHLRRALHALAT